MTYTLKNKITGDVYRDIPGDDLHRFDVRIFDIVEQTSEGDALILQDFVEGHLGMQENRKKWIEARFIIDDRWMGWGDFIFTEYHFKSEYPERTRKDFPARCMGRTPEGEFWKELP